MFSLTRFGWLFIVFVLFSLFFSHTSADAVDHLAVVSLHGANHTTCTKDKLTVRKEYGRLTIAERRNYIKAIQCLMTKPSQFSPSEVPGAKNRYDDFVAVHVQQTFNIHATASFLSWHRYFTWAYEYALRTECGYKGAQPYWNWGKYPDPLKSPIFDGSATSMGGNGQYVPHGGHAVGSANVVVPGGNGGGCINTGPFKNMSVHLGPLATSIDVNLTANPQADGLGYNPRCVRRDITDYFTKQYLRVQDIESLITQTSNISSFQDVMQIDTAAGVFGVHSGGHFTIWGDPGGDFFTSPGDPAFFLHHGMIDRTWWIWQNQDPANRVMTVAGNVSLFGGPEGTLDDDVNLAVLAPTWKIKDLVSSTAGPFCYVYQ
ncbi:Di-copper centre-containing protein [Lojkania enalia]|uniref:Di-copper centre-containing protein n=1 Tax=Lojkania enalia TaxID=147567 RepID=A0A9P4MY79_9PLEO|nr:Di-copper centre-containing protein [Didymosphaeria enalia]